ncbi:MAG TPA: DEAD/DEAH box helicase, partial [Solirubrobacterales bacterium]|nr:DEAD/DEAH box helicase [Solirubrobacterales bacterium]
TAAQESPMSKQSFAALGVSAPVVQALAARGITTPFAIQERVTADVLAGHDVLASSPTGSGKTLAFAVPIADRIEATDRRPSALVLAPTRELASQLVDEARSVAHARALGIAAVYGGVSIGKQARDAAKAHILVATPGRLEDLIARGAVTLAHVKVLVLDEADRMLDMGFKPAVDRIVSLTPAKRQTLFFSATLEGATGKVAAAYTRDARRHTHAPKQAKADIEHRFLPVSTQGEKIDHLVEQLRDEDCGPTLVFVRTKRGADRLVKRLRGRSVEAVAMHGDKSQKQRERALARFEDGEVEALVATDVAARGIDVEGVTHVINYDAPEDRDAYVHRIGRTGRAGRQGTGVSFVLAEQVDDVRRMAGDLGLVREFEKAHGGRKKQMTSRPGPRRSPRGRKAAQRA